MQRELTGCGKQPGNVSCKDPARHDSMVLASVTFRVQPHKRAEVLSAIDETVERMRHTLSCARCRLLVDTEDPNLFTLASEWAAARDADAFFESREFQVFRGIRMLLREEPVVQMDEVQARATRLIRAR
jgi:quinol monooxygenase YgiN